MPLIYNDALDDPYIWEQCPDFSGGQVSFAKPATLGVNQAAYLQNVIIHITGQLRKRRGTLNLSNSYVAVADKRIQCLFWYDTALTNKLLAVCNGKFYEFNESTDTWDIYFEAAISDHDEMVSVCQLSDNLWWTDSGSGGIRRWNGATVSTILGASVPVATIMECFTNRLIASGVSTVPDAIYFSDILDGSVWNVLNILRVGADGDPIVAIQSWADSLLIVFKKQSTWLVDISPIVSVASFPIKNIHRTVGCVGWRTVSQVGQDVFFLSRNGVMSIQKQLATSNNVIAVPQSLPVQDVIQSIRWEYAHKSVSIFYANTYILIVPVNSTEPDVCIAWSELTKSWVGVWTGFVATDFIEQPYLGSTRLLLGSAKGAVKTSLDALPEGEESNDTFQDEPTPSQEYLQVASDDFDSYANGAALGSQLGWTAITTGVLSIRKPATLGEVYVSTADGNGAAYCKRTLETYTTEQYAEVTMGTIIANDSGMGAAINIQAAANERYMAVYYDESSGWEGSGIWLYKVNSLDAFSELAKASPLTLVAGDVLRLERWGTGPATRLTVKKNGAVVVGLDQINPMTYLSGGTTGIWGWAYPGSPTANGAASWRAGNLYTTTGNIVLPTVIPTTLSSASDVVSVVRTRAMEFNDVMSPKTGWYLEAEFYSKDGDITLGVILDGAPKIMLDEWTFSASGAILTLTLPFYLGITKWIKKKYPIWNLGRFREIQVEITAPHGNLILRRIILSAQLDTVETNQELELI